MGPSSDWFVTVKFVTVALTAKTPCRFDMPGVTKILLVSIEMAFINPLVSIVPVDSTGPNVDVENTLNVWLCMPPVTTKEPKLTGPLTIKPLEYIVAVAAILPKMFKP